MYGLQNPMHLLNLNWKLLFNKSVEQLGKQERVPFKLFACFCLCRCHSSDICICIHV